MRERRRRCESPRQCNSWHWEKPLLGLVVASNGSMAMSRSVFPPSADSFTCEQSGNLVFDSLVDYNLVTHVHYIEHFADHVASCGICHALVSIADPRKAIQPGHLGRMEKFRLEEAQLSRGSPEERRGRVMRKNRRAVKVGDAKMYDNYTGWNDANSGRNVNKIVTEWLTLSEVRG